MKKEKYIWILFFVGIILFLLVKYYKSIENPQQLVKPVSTIVDVGLIKKNEIEKITGTFSLQNLSSNVIEIKEIIPDCLCTIADYNSNLIYPNTTFEIVAYYNENSIGYFEQTLTVYFEDPKISPVLLVFRGKIIDSKNVE